FNVGLGGWSDRMELMPDLNRTAQTREKVKFLVFSASLRAESLNTQQASLRENPELATDRAG
ncbi:MAG TPA: hypothetical protein VF813_10775, partial [Anaerolineaceae bacterium]